MRVRISLPIDDSRSRRVGEQFMRILPQVDYPWPFERLELHVRDEQGVVVRGPVGFVLVDYRDPFISQEDERGIAVILMRLLFQLQMVLQNPTLPAFLQGIAANRAMIRAGFGEALMGYYYQRQAVLRSRDVEQHVGWLSFAPLDPVHADTLRRQTLPDHHLTRFFDCVLKDLDDPAHGAHAARVYREIAA